MPLSPSSSSRWYRHRRAIPMNQVQGAFGDGETLVSPPRSRPGSSQQSPRRPTSSSPSASMPPARAWTSDEKGPVLPPAVRSAKRPQPPSRHGGMQLAPVSPRSQDVDISAPKWQQRQMLGAALASGPRNPSSMSPSAPVSPRGGRRGGRSAAGSAANTGNMPSRRLQAASRHDALGVANSGSRSVANSGILPSRRLQANRSDARSVGPSPVVRPRSVTPNFFRETAQQQQQLNNDF